MSRPAGGSALRYVALGDSYTIGTATERNEERWPDQLVARLNAEAPVLELVANLGVNGYTSRDVIETELPRLAALRPDFATLLVGVNDVVQGVPEATYAANAAHILDELLAALPANRIVSVATPDYTVTPQGAAYGDPSSRPRGSAGTTRSCATLRPSEGSPSSTFTTCRCEPPTIARSSRSTASIRPAPSTRCGSTGSRRSWRS